MRALRLCVTAVVGLLIGAPVGGAWQPREPSHPPGGRDSRNSHASARPAAPPSAPRTARAEQHPCDWVETCQFPCGGEGNTCCHAEWNCPPDLTLPRC